MVQTRWQVRFTRAVAVIPEQVLGPIVGWSMRFVTDFAGDVLAADRLWNDRRALAGAGQKMSTTDAQDALRDLLAEHLATNRPLPGRGGVLNEFFLATTIGSSRLFIGRSRPQIDAVAAVVGIGELSYYRPPDGLLDGRPWVEGIVTVHDHHHGGLATLARMLQGACYVVIAYLSGMRDGEVKHLDGIACESIGTRTATLSVDGDQPGVQGRT